MTIGGPFGIGVDEPGISELWAFHRFGGGVGGVDLDSAPSEGGNALFFKGAGFTYPRTPAFGFVCPRTPARNLCSVIA